MTNGGKGGLRALDEILLSLMVSKWRLSPLDRESLLALWRKDGARDSLVAFAESSGLVRARSEATLKLIDQGVLGLRGAGHVLARDGRERLRQLLAARKPEVAGLAGTRTTRVDLRKRAGLRPASGRREKAVAPGKLLPGRRLGRCLIVRELAKGSSCTVYEGLHESLQIPVAIKVFRMREDAMADFRELFSGEARQLARLSHPNIIRVLDFEDGETPYIVMEFARGMSLADILESQRAVTIKRGLRIMQETADALAYAHAAGIVHRDVKPANLLFDEAGSVKLSDLGIAWLGDAGGFWHRQSPEALCGTPLYVAPEQAFQPDEVDGKADVYSLGATMYHALAGRPPFENESARDLVLMHVSAEVPHLQSLRPDATKDLAGLIGQMLAKRPDERPEMTTVAALAGGMLASGNLRRNGRVRDDDERPKTIAMMLRRKIRRSDG